MIAEIVLAVDDPVKRVALLKSAINRAVNQMTDEQLVQVLAIIQGEQV